MSKCQACSIVSLYSAIDETISRAFKFILTANDTLEDNYFCHTLNLQLYTIFKTCDGVDSKQQINCSHQLRKERQIFFVQFDFIRDSGISTHRAYRRRQGKKLCQAFRNKRDFLIGKRYFGIPLLDA